MKITSLIFKFGIGGLEKKNLTCLPKEKKKNHKRAILITCVMANTDPLSIDKTFS